MFGSELIRRELALAREAGKPVWDWQAPAKDEPLIAKVNALAEEKLRAAYQLRNKQARTHALREATASVLAGLKAGEQVALDPVRAGLSGAQPAAK